MKLAPLLFLAGAIMMIHTSWGAAALSPQQKRSAALQILQTFETGGLRALSVVSPAKYIEHDLRFESGVPALRKRVSRVPAGLKVNTVRALVDGDFVVLHSEYRTPQKRIAFDIFRFENDKIVEHWDNIEDAAHAPNASGRTGDFRAICKPRIRLPG